MMLNTANSRYRETRYLTSDQAQTLVDRATALLDSSEWSDVAAGLAVLIGRRISEILLSRFFLKSPWSITFSGMALVGRCYRIDVREAWR